MEKLERKGSGYMPPIRHVCTLLLIKNWDKEGFTIKQTGGNLFKFELEQ